MAKFLIIQTAFIGDVILATPLIEKLHHFYPDSQIDFLLRKGNEDLLRNHPYVHNILIWNKKQDKLKNMLRVIKRIRQKKYDYVMNLQRFTSTGIITVFSGAALKVGFNKNPFSFAFSRSIKHEIGNGKHETERNLQLIEEITDNTFFKPKLYPTREDFERVAQYKMHPYLCIAPTSVWFTKQFPAEKWIDLLKKTAPGIQVFFLGGPDDREACDQIIKASGLKNITNLAGKLTFLQTSALMKNAIMNYVNDSAPLHMASAMNAKTSAIFCSTVPAFGFGPLADHSKVVETEEKLDCRPCGLHGYKKCPQGHFKCALTIKTEHLTL
ncbi:MAG: glycosyltransferase family 9 protein [Bacteroidales bacterium]|jgi:heptosyltransferase-2|nr:glycosyltransferase family 9 protein [Bacteroidales bacterium]